MKVTVRKFVGCAIAYLWLFLPLQVFLVLCAVFLMGLAEAFLKHLPNLYWYGAVLVFATMVALLMMLAVEGICAMREWLDPLLLHKLNLRPPWETSKK